METTEKNTIDEEKKHRLTMMAAVKTIISVSISTKLLSNLDKNEDKQI